MISIAITLMKTGNDERLRRVMDCADDDLVGVMRSGRGDECDGE